MLSKFSQRDLENLTELEFKIYHGTSSVFLESIQKDGFGYRDQEIFNEEILKYLWDSLKHIDSEFTRRYAYIISNMISGRGRYLYEGIYFTASKGQAEIHAGNRYGEYIGMIFNCYKELLIYDNKKATSIIPPEHKLHEIFNTEHKPILISLNRAKTSWLKGENDSELLEVLKKIYDIYWSCNLHQEENPDEAFSEWMQQHVMVLKEQLDYDLLDIEYLNQDDLEKKFENAFF